MVFNLGAVLLLAHGLHRRDTFGRGSVRGAGFQTLLSTAHEGEAVLEPHTLSPYWRPSIQRWADYIEALSNAYGFDPDFIAAVIKHESDGDEQVVSHMGAVGLMGVMPYGPGLEWRPLPDELLIPATNLRWGMLILSHVVQQSGGDLFAALAAYNGGWSRSTAVNRVSTPPVYSTVMRERSLPGTDSHRTWRPDGPWPSRLVRQCADGGVANTRPAAGFGYRLFAEHTVYAQTDDYGRPYFVRGYIVPVGLTDIVENIAQPDEAHSLEASLQARSGTRRIRKLLAIRASCWFVYLA